MSDLARDLTLTVFKISASLINSNVIVSYIIEQLSLNMNQNVIMSQEDSPEDRQNSEFEALKVSLVFT